MDRCLVATSEASTPLAAGAGARRGVLFHWRSPGRAESGLGGGMVKFIWAGSGWAYIRKSVAGWLICHEGGEVTFRPFILMTVECTSRQGRLRCGRPRELMIRASICIGEILLPRGSIPLSPGIDDRQSKKICSTDHFVVWESGR